jgi:xanthine dehydrogenase accessory factor
MNKELEILQFVAERLKRNESVMLLVVAESAGSSPGRVGFKMAVAGDELRGSIGGGVMEVRLVEQARAILEEEKRRRGEEEKSGFITSQVHQKNSPNPSGMICSGRQTVIFYKLNSKDLKTVGAIIRALKSRQPKILCISDSKFQISDKQFEEFDFKFVRQGENDFFYEEKLGCKNRLFIVGGGHCALALSEIAAKIDFHITLFDDRPNLNTLEKNKFVNEKKIIESYEKINEFIASGANFYVVVMTLGYKSDEVVIRKLLDKDFKYFGVLGSKAKMSALLRNLRIEGFSAEKLDKIRTPIGLPINSRTPEEIAVSIAAEIIAVKNSKD